MTLRDQLLKNLEQELKAIQAAIFIIQSSETLGAIDLESVASTVKRAKRTSPPMARPSPPADEDKDDDRDEWGDPKPKVECEKCHEKFPNEKSRDIHKKRVHFGRT